ncbi:hypothetical protein [Mycolicibacterium bacteremicum]|uniref:hypothetical protein n=1 Tax=Mycolicibacterium bacteremicum TaxID=564198 RepID=UPI0026EF4F01|nr:hypothetical protein [Mycolicibacterium bacteremicum]
MSRAEPGGVTLTATEVRLVLFAVGDVISRFWFARKSLDRGFYALHARLAGFVDETKSCASQLDSTLSVVEELIDTNQAAAILGCTPQWVGQIRDKLGVRQIGSQRVFPRQTVVEYAQRKADRKK